MTLDWKPGIGDPTFVGWFTVVAYLATAGLCAVVARRLAANLPEEQLGRQSQAWWMLSLFLIALGANKQLDLQGLLVAVGRLVADRQGWYEERRNVQLVFIVVLMALAASGLTVMLWVIRRRWREYGWMSVGVALMVTFVVVRAVSFHHFQEFFAIPLGGVKIHRLLELTGIGFLAAAALKRLAATATIGRP